MVSFKTGGLRLLQAAALISSVTARCTPCSASDKLLLLLRAQGEAELAPFCAAFLGAPASTVEVTVTPTTFVPPPSFYSDDCAWLSRGIRATTNLELCNRVVSVTSTVVVTEVSTFYEEVVTISVPATVTAPATVAASTPEYTMEKKAKRTVDYPEWLASTYSPERVSSACQCLSIPAASEATVTATATAEAVTLTDDATVTETITNTVTTDIGVVTQTVWTTVVPTPTPSTVAQRAIISVHHKGTGALVGYVYMSSGPAITTDRTLAAVVKFDMPAGATTASKLRLLVEGYSPSALSFQCPVNLELQNYYGSMTLNGNPSKRLRPPFCCLD